jgi:3-methylcrotonyl-CoA carboxylase alpha subunit
MNMHRLRAVTEAGTFIVEVEADAGRARLRFESTSSEPAAPRKTEPPRETPHPRDTGQPRETERPRDGETFQLASIDSDVVSVIPDGADRTAEVGQAAPLRAHVVGDGDTTWVFIDGETFRIEVEPAERVKARRGSTGSEGLAAPMPATVIKVLLQPGAEVRRGDLLVLLEAMKMELPIRAPRDGRVKALHCRPGELVQPGTTLVDLE